MDINLFEDNDADSRQVQMLRNRIARLGPFDRAIVLLWLENMSYEEIGQVIGMRSDLRHPALSQATEDAPAGH